MKYWNRTWTPIRGCQPISAGCVNCFAAAAAARSAGEGGCHHGLVEKTAQGWRWTGRIRVDEAAFGRLARMRVGPVFAGLMTDLFQKAVPDELISRILSEVARASVPVLMLTKRAERMRDCVRAQDLPPKTMQHVYFGVTVESANYSWRLDFLSDLAALGYRTWISQEPALEAPCWDRVVAFPADNRPRFIVAGGETGSRAREADLDWFRETREFCGRHGIGFAFKGVGRYLARTLCRDDLHRLDGVTHNLLPWSVS